MSNDRLIVVIRDFLIRSFAPSARPDELPEDLDLIRSGILNSLALIETASFLEELSGTKIEAHKLNPGNVGTIGAMAAMVQQCRENA